ncbi:MAG: hypothetical protein ACLFS9_04540 [Nitriliruptoraceae bacterium]
MSAYRSPQVTSCGGARVRVGDLRELAPSTGTAAPLPAQEPVLDRAVLTRLAACLGSREIARTYVEVVLLHGPGWCDRVHDAVEREDVTGLRSHLAALQEQARFLGLSRLTATCMAAERELGPGGAHEHEAVASGALRWWGRAVTDELAIGFARLTHDRSLL